MRLDGNTELRVGCLDDKPVRRVTIAQRVALLVQLRHRLRGLRIEGITALVLACHPEPQPGCNCDGEERIDDRNWSVKQSQFCMSVIKVNTCDPLI
jgi:hypothetical protein